MTKYNLKFIKELTSNNESEIQEFLLIFCRDVFDAVNKIKDGFEQKNIEQMRFFAHKMKASLSYLDLQEELSTVIEIEKTPDFSHHTALKEKVDLVAHNLLQTIKDIKSNELITESSKA